MLRQVARLFGGAALAKILEVGHARQCTRSEAEPPAILLSRANLREKEAVVHLEPLYQFAATLRPQPIGPTPDGMRIDVEFEGDLDPGGRLTGHLKAVNYVTVRGDGVQLVDVRGTISRSDGAVVSFMANGITVPAAGGSAVVRDAATYQTASSDLEWLNRTIGFIGGTADLRTGELRLAAYTLED
jgi:Protein of unknown function (DUF3237)